MWYMLVCAHICTCDYSYGVMHLYVYAYVCSNAHMICVYVCVVRVCIHTMCVLEVEVLSSYVLPVEILILEGKDKPLPGMCLEAQSPETVLVS